MRKRTWIGIILAACIFIFLLRTVTAGRNPISWDEPVYLSASRAYMSWVGLVFDEFVQGHFAAPFSKENINKYWQRHTPHPPLSKTINGVTHIVLSPLFGKLAGIRAGSALFYALLFAAVIWHAHRLGGPVPAFGAAVALFVNPRFFYHAGTGNLDTIATVFGYFTILYYWKSSGDRSVIATLLSGLLWGCTFAAKNSAFLILPILFLWTLLWSRKLYLFLRLALMQVIAFLFLIAIWPWMYHDTGQHLHEYWRFAGLERMVTRYTDVVFKPSEQKVEELTQERSFGGRKFPWYYSYRAIFTVIPVPTLLLFVLGTIISLWRWRNADLGLPLLGAWVPMILTSLPSTPIYDMERFLLICMPFLSVLAGYGLFELIKRAQTRFGQSTRTAAAALALLCLCYVPALREWIYLHPIELSYYNAFVGGLRGAVEKDLPRSYWLVGYWGLRDYMNEQLPRECKVAADNYLVYKNYKKYKLLRPGLQPCRGLGKGMSKCDFLMKQEPIPKWAEGTMPRVYTYSLHGIPLASVYKVTPEYVKALLAKNQRKELEREQEQQQEEEEDQDQDEPGAE